MTHIRALFQLAIGLLYSRAASGLALRGLEPQHGQAVLGGGGGGGYIPLPAIIPEACGSCDGADPCAVADLPLLLRAVDPADPNAGREAVVDCAARARDAITRTIQKKARDAAEGRITAPEAIADLRILAGVEDRLVALLGPDAQRPASPLDADAAVRYVRQVCDTASLFLIIHQAASPESAPVSPTQLALDWLVGSNDSSRPQPWPIFATEAGLRPHASYPDPASGGSPLALSKLAASLKVALATGRTCPKPQGSNSNPWFPFPFSLSFAHAREEIEIPGEIADGYNLAHLLLSSSSSSSSDQPNGKTNLADAFEFLLLRGGSASRAAALARRCPGFRAAGGVVSLRSVS